MAITVMGGGTKTTTEDVNLDPQKQFWSFLSAFAPETTGKIAGFPVQQTTPAGLSVQVGGASTDSAIITLDGRKYLLSTDGEAQTVALETAPSANSRIDAIVSYLDFSDTDSSSETPGTPEYVKTIAVVGTVASSPSAPTDAEIQAALPASANGVYIQWGTVAVGTGATQVVDSDITVNSITVAASKEDVLETAQDLTALNNSGVVKTSNIANGAVTADKIDFTTFGNAVKTFGSIYPYTEASAGYIEVPAGTYLVLIQGLCNFTETDSYGCTIRARVGSVSGSEICLANAWMGDAYDVSISAFGLVTTTNETTRIHYTNQADESSTVQLSQRKLAVIRVG